MDRITVNAQIEASPARVWQAYTTPEEIARWNSASDDWCCPYAEVDLRVGGAYKARMEARDGSAGFDFEGVYEEIRPEELLALTLADGRRVRTTFEPTAGGTRVTTVFDAESVHPADLQRDGWQAILDNFRRYVES